VFELSKRDRKINEYYGLVGLHSLENNDGIDKMLRTPNLLLAKFKEKQILELSVKVVLANKKPNYKSIEFCDFHFIRFLGNGGFSSVFLARCLIDGRLCALKLIKKSSMSQNKYRMLEN
jgi:serum/glucocorticoid-regulated kinase 2